ncbi:hypothetical protein [Dinoroseobacter sp. S124A]|uniref:hypothetical protein n=1 Tax=Dinoroseobacter sp. S124A TaxID=3415128 RepID=UPI003C7D64F1
MRERLKHWGETLIVVGVVCGAAWGVAGGKILQGLDSLIALAIEERGGGPCAHIPANGHRITGGLPGGWGEVVWRDVVRLRANCGVPVVSGVLTNGGGYFHDAPLSISGIPLSVGAHELGYLFQINPEVRPGHARFRVVVTYPDAVGGAPPAISPWLSFRVIDPEGVE